MKRIIQQRSSIIVCLALVTSVALFALSNYGIPAYVGAAKG